MNSKVESEIRRANVKLKKLIQNEITRQKLIDTGAMIKSITTEFTLSRRKLNIKLGAIYYYKFLDNGTRYITARKITKNVISGNEFKNLEKRLIASIAKIEIIDQIKRFNEKGAFEGAFLLKNI